MKFHNLYLRDFRFVGQCCENEPTSTIRNQRDERHNIGVSQVIQELLLFINP